MTKCTGTKSDGSPCGQVLFECPDCGSVGCYPSYGNCTNSLQNNDGVCKTCGSIGAPSEYIAYNNAGADYKIENDYDES